MEIYLHLKIDQRETLYLYSIPTLKSQSWDHNYSKWPQHDEVSMLGTQGANTDSFEHISNEGSSPVLHINDVDQAVHQNVSPPSLPSTSAASLLTHNKFEVDGCRIVNINYFFKQIMDSGKHTPFDCSITNMELIREQRKGLHSVYTLKCSMCNKMQDIYSQKADIDDDVDINTAMALGTLSTGIGFSQCLELFSSINIPFMAESTFIRKQEYLGSVVHDTALKVMEEAGKEEAELAKAAGEVDANGTPCITVIADGAWSKRSYNVNYNAASGVACIVGQRTGKLLYLGVRNKYCCLCTRAAKSELPCPEHLCYRNWMGTSTGMESDIIVDGFKNSIRMHGVKYTKLVGDGDSSVHKKLLLAKPYGNILIEKIECKNHLYRNFASKLRELSNKTRSASKGAVVSIVLRRVVLSSVQKFCGIIKKATEYRINEDAQLVEKITSLRTDILNTPHHIFGDHDMCHTLPYIMCNPQDNERNCISDMRTCGLYDDIVTCLHRLINNSSSLLLDMNNNDAEHYNAVLCKFVGGKRINFTQRGSYEYRCEAAVISFNSKGNYHSVMHKALTTSNSPQSFKKRFIDRKIRSRMLWKERRHSVLFRRRKQRQRGPDGEYGMVVSLSDAPDLTDESLEVKKKEYLDLLQKTSNEIANIERATIGQTANPKWAEERTFRLSASNFGSVCKMRITTSRAKKVQQLLYNKFGGNAATTYGSQNETLAIKDFENAFGLVDLCGFFIHPLFGYIGASPDGLIGIDGLIEVKCPANSKLFHPVDAVKKKVIKFVNIDSIGNMSLKRNHDYFYQVQGQLEVTNRCYCYFIVWTPKGMLVEKISRDVNFWKERMEEQLKCFFLQCMLPEIVDSRKSRGLQIRSPLRI